MNKPFRLALRSLGVSPKHENGTLKDKAEFFNEVYAAMMREAPEVRPIFAAALYGLPVDTDGL